MGWLPKCQSVMGAMLHHSLSGGIQLGILQGWLTWYKLYRAAAEHLNRLDSYVKFMGFWKKWKGFLQKREDIVENTAETYWIISPSEVKVLQLMEGVHWIFL